jgi:Na+/proline symporter
MFLGLVILPIVAWFSMDIDGSVTDYLTNIDPNLSNIWGGDDVIMNTFTIIGFAMIGLGFLGSPQVYVRFMSVKNEAEISKGAWVAILFTIITDAAAVSIGVLARIFFTESGQDAEVILGNGGENVLNMMTTEFLPLTIMAIYVAIVLSAIMSTIDYLIVIASSAITRDFYQKIFRPNIDKRKLVRISRNVTLGMALIALGIAVIMELVSPDRELFWVIIFGWSGIAATFCPVIILSLFWKGYSEKGAIASMLSGFLCVPLFKFVLQEIDGIGIYLEKLDVLFPSFVVAMVVGYVVSKVYPPQHSLTED